MAVPVSCTQRGGAGGLVDDEGAQKGEAPAAHVEDPTARVEGGEVRHLERAQETGPPGRLGDCHGCRGVAQTSPANSGEPIHWRAKEGPLSNPYEAPSAPVGTAAEFHYVGFWARVLATLIDGILTALITLPLLYLVYGGEYFTSTSFYHGGWEVAINYGLPAALVLLFWHFFSATPGKMVIGARIVDVATGEKPSTAQFVGRYVGYFPSFFVLALGCLWVAWDSRKQGWHDKLAGTAVVAGGERARPRHSAETPNLPPALD